MADTVRGVAPWPPAFSPEFLASARRLLEHRGALLVVGPPGSNRQLLAAGVVRAGEPAWEHTSTHGDEARPFHALQAFADHLHGATSTPAEPVEHVRDLLRASDDSMPTVVLSDLDFCDAESLAGFATLVVTRDIRVIVITTHETLPAAAQFTAVGERLDLEGLTPEAVARLLQSRFAALPHRTVTSFLHQRTHGSYAAMCTLADAAAETRVLVQVEGVLMLDPSHIEDLRRTLPDRREPRSAARLGTTAGVTALLDVVSIVGAVEAEEAATCFDPADIDLAVRHGALQVDAGTISMADPLEAESVIVQLGRDRMKTLWETYGSLLPRSTTRGGSAVRSARWCWDAGVPLPPALAVAGARSANVYGVHERAVYFTEAGSVAGVAPTERAYALMQLGDHAKLQAMYDVIDPAEVPEDDLVPYLTWAVWFAPHGLDADMRARVVGSRGDAESRRSRDAVVTLTDVLLTMFDRSSGELIRSVRSSAMSGVLSPVNRAYAYLALGVLLRNAAQVDESVEAANTSVEIFRSESGTHSAVHLDAALELLFLSHLAAFDTAAAEAVLDEYSARPATYGRQGRAGLPLGVLIDVHRGTIPLVLAGARVFVDTLGPELSQVTHGARGWVEAMAACALVTAGRNEEAEAMLTTSEAHPPLHHHQHDLERRLAQASTHDMLGDPDRALEMLADIASEAREHGLRLVEIEAAGLAVLVDGPSRLDALHESLVGVDEQRGTPRFWSEFSRAARAYDFAALTDLAHRMHRQQHLFFSTRVAQYVLDSARRASDLDQATRTTLGHIADGEDSADLRRGS